MEKKEKRKCALTLAAGVETWDEQDNLVVVARIHLSLSFVSRCRISHALLNNWKNGQWICIFLNNPAISVRQCQCTVGSFSTNDRIILETVAWSRANCHLNHLFRLVGRNADNTRVYDELNRILIFRSRWEKTSFLSNFDASRSVWITLIFLVDFAKIQATFARCRTVIRVEGWNFCHLRILANSHTQHSSSRRRRRRCRDFNTKSPFGTYIRVSHVSISI